MLVEALIDRKIYRLLACIRIRRYLRQNENTILSNLHRLMRSRKRSHISIPTSSHIGNSSSLSADFKGMGSIAGSRAIVDQGPDPLSMLGSSSGSSRHSRERNIYGADFNYSEVVDLKAEGAGQRGAGIGERDRGNTGGDIRGDRIEASDRARDKNTTQTSLTSRAREFLQFGVLSKPRSSMYDDSTRNSKSKSVLSKSRSIQNDIYKNIAGTSGGASTRRLSRENPGLGASIGNMGDTGGTGSGSNSSMASTVHSSVGVADNLDSRKTPPRKGTIIGRGRGIQNHNVSTITFPSSSTDASDIGDSRDRMLSHVCMLSPTLISSLSQSPPDVSSEHRVTSVYGKNSVDMV
jgi:hypothetical protein